MNSPKDNININPKGVHTSLWPAFWSLVFALLLSVTTLAQVDEPAQIAPPPLKVVSKDERSRLDASADMKVRTRLLIELMRDRVASAERLNSKAEFEAMYTQLGAFHGLMDNGLEFLKKQDINNNKVLDAFKRLEIGFREFAPRLEAIRRDLPLKFEDYVRRLIKYLREARTVATEPQFAETVLPGTPSPE